MLLTLSLLQDDIYYVSVRRKSLTGQFDGAYRLVSRPNVEINIFGSIGIHVPQAIISKIWSPTVQKVYILAFTPHQ